ncbi:LOW QUALITY PROTEIN: hypothetical protein PHMEG_00019961 [Phytophthora megakarya]|uniref:Integrase catalytic domain-containing protein n=1 Tax=Phytophthora megakarya TaxID=4795 RepID=A0A225VQ67_9STRA|nr:LOW QUALITY PROTEIN: hypothetical protein PHMEG_00019961 [Phytophthora megakarya]
MCSQSDHSRWCQWTFAEISSGEYRYVVMALIRYRFAKATSDTDALTVAKVFEECIYRRFGAPSLIRHDRDLRFMNEVFQAFAELIQARSRSTLSYRPPANGQQERSVKTVMQSIKVYVEDPLQQDWDEIAERLVFAINNFHDMTRKETPLYLVHGWDAHTTLRAMTTSLKRGVGKQTEALAWRREINRQQQIALEMAKEYQAVEKARRARIHNENLSCKEQVAIPKSVNDDWSDDDSELKSLFRPGSRVWLYMERVKPGLVKKLAHRWHGPFRMKRKVGEIRDARLDFDEELLPEDSWEAAAVDGKFEVEAILDDRTPISASTARLLREFEVKWVGYESTT